MAPPERHRAAAIDQTWDAFVRGEPVTNPDHADAPLKAVVARLQATSAIPTLFPDPERSWRELRAEIAGQTKAAASPELPVGPWPVPNGRETTPADPWTQPLPRRSPPRWLLNQLATAALLLLTVAAGFLMLWQGAGREREADTWLPDTIVSSLPGYAEDVVFEATFAAEELPAGPAAAIFYRVTLPPGTTLPYLAGTNCMHSSCNMDEVTVGVGAELVEAGAYGLQLDGPIWVQRDGTSATKLEIPTGQDVVLDAGDAAIFHDYTVTGEIRDAGSGPLRLLGIAIVNFASGGKPIADLPPQISDELLDISLTTDWDALPEGPVTVVLRRVTLPAATLMPPFEPRGLESIRVERGAIAWTFAHSAEAAADGLRIHRRAGETAPFAISPDGALRFLETTSDDPAELLVLTIEAAGVNGNPLGP